MSRIGKMYFQANSKEDVFLSLDVLKSGNKPTEESLCNLQPLLFNASDPWINGELPKKSVVNIAPDTSLVHARLEEENFTIPYTITVYLECEVEDDTLTEPINMDETDCVNLSDECYIPQIEKEEEGPDPEPYI